ncbi:Rod shape-determining protein MreD [Piscirickettsia salmonis]|uniref:rod shape-determining protein MreD n=2 Tax=Piscirickettsia salmonis TaxID=1238 RepID=UPI0012B8DB51|nr:rod shape-determining protein MreD [Piscirickettsia salmonis]QGP51282.1 Rod shape-determining protein MreD [Piscirickettsia salmonis]
MRSYMHRTERYLSQCLIAFATILLALLLEMLVVSGGLVYFWPQWLLLVVCYWTVRAPDMLPLGGVLLLGLALDVIHANVLGIHAVILLALVYLVRKFHKRFRLFPVLQQAFFMMLITLVYQAALLGFEYWLHAEKSSALFNPWHQVTIVSSFVSWPLLQFLLNSLSGRREHG